MSHPFGDLLHQHLHRRHGLTQSKLAAGIFQDPAIISAMCHGRRLTGKQVRERVLDIISWLQAQTVLTTQDEANALLHAAGLIGLQADVPEEAALLAKLSSALEPAIDISEHLTDLAESPLASKQDSPSSLPQPMTPFVGRQHELAQLMERLANPACRLLSLVGPGGFGKTRLGIRIGELVQDRPDLAPDGLFFVALDGLESPARVVPAIATTLNYSFQEQDDPERQLLRYLKQKRILLILDNAEGVLDANLVLRLLGAAPSLKILVTTREALNVREEWFHPIVGMRLNDGDEQATHSDALDLFNRCALRVRPDFQPVDEYTHVQAICRSVGGVPLAIELAAAWLKGLTCRQVASELKQGIDILTSSMRDMPERHRSLRAVLEQSWRHLSEEEQRVFRHLSIFPGGFQPEAAQVVADASLPGLVSLVDKSVLQLGQDGRYRIHPLLRQVGRERLMTNLVEHAAVATRYSTYYLKIIAHPAGAYLGRGGTQRVEAIKTEINNVFAAWYLAADQERIGDLHAAMEGLYWFSWLSTYHEECERAFRYVIDMLRDNQDNSEHRIAYAFALCCLGTMTIWLGRDQAENTELPESVALLRNLPTARRELAYAVGGLGWSLFADSKFEEAKPLIYEAVELHLETGQFELQAWTYCLLGNTALKQNDYQAYERWYQQALRLGREIGDQRTITHALCVLGRLASQRGQYDKADRYLDECLQLARSSNLHAFVVEALGELGKLSEAIGELERGAYYLQQGVNVARLWGKEDFVAESLEKLARIHTTKGDYDTAAALYQEARDLLHNNHPSVVYLLAGMGRLALDTHDHVAARLHYESCLGMSSRSGNRLVSVEALVGLGLATLRQGAKADAKHHLFVALQEGLVIGFAPILLATVTAVAEFLTTSGDLAYAAELATVAKQNRASTAATKASASKLLALAKADLPSETYRVATGNTVDGTPVDIALNLMTALSDTDRQG